ncbi:Nitrate regulatory gene2 protein [Camellia lanceoleosa]|uniref:Nitrate regulatory gene2 protein n=1 Tax=Camellia lanceoleosa TaxID=1840588 RepID=A0ACC0IYB8_9ERIC|nr:Nitrate regulatory gene2 protein [Camellia lanceoleosa]
MGCGLSTMDNSEIVKLCRERKDLIKAAKDWRYALASAHNSYFQSLLDVGNSLQKLVEEEVMTSVEPPSSTHSDHQSNGEGSHLEISSLESDTDISSLTDYVHEGSEFSEQSPEEDEIQEGVNSNIYHTQKYSDEVSTGVYEQPQVVDATAQWHNPSNLMAQYPQYGNGVFSGGPMNFMPNNPRFLQYGNGGFFGGLMNLPPFNPMFSQYGNGVSFGGLMNFPHPNLKLSQDRNEVPFGGPMNFPPNNLDFPPNGDGVSFDIPMNLPPADLRFPRYGNVNFPDNNLRSDHHGMEANFTSFAFSYPQYGNGVPYGGSIYFLPNDPRYNLRQSRNAPENLPPPEVSSWDYLNPFSVIDDTFSRYYFEGRYETGFGSIGPDLREVREKEGIPDLEVEAEKEEEDPVEKQPKEIETEVKNKGDTVEGRCETVQLKGDSGEGSFEAVPLKEDSSKGPSESAPLKNGEDDLLAQDKEITRSPGVPEAQEKDHESIEKDTEGNSEKSNCLEEEENGSSENVKVQEELEQEGVCPVQVSSTTINTYESRDLKEVLKDIKDACETAFDHGKELSVALEIGKLQYQPRSAIVKVLSSWFLSFVAVKRVKAKNGSLEKDECMNTVNLSSILEQLSTWEKKLYKEVKDEERLRRIYAKEQKKLKKFDDRGVESSKIDATYNSIKKLLLKIKVAVSTVDAISKRINKLRDEELRPRLNELILSLTGMWTFMVDCHRKQFQAMLEGKTQLQIAQAAIERNSNIMAV